MKADKTENKQTFPERANLLPELSKKLEQWAQQVVDRSQGSVKVSKSDLVNFFLEQIPEHLTDGHIIGIEKRFHNESRWITWAMAQIKLGIRNGEACTLEGLLAERKKRWDIVSAKADRDSRHPRKSKVESMEGHDATSSTE